MGGRELSVPHMQDREEAVADQREQSFGDMVEIALEAAFA